ncbi:hypothetical protein BO71DRAFT_448962 [Aspergillus ellipticus CBS 707.79]|uniref:SET domain-containing protein n=1 Tax=Aspergillus ellipticus CBS 707.79 TaxID=1448320 RepID=A0A319DPF7_9EURO|nr:hypothetical protein BO71DRAFT_448962 [Aspergillus ellipticus CBS 707.79]
MAIIPTFGTGLFIGAGQALAAGGPASLLVSYILISGLAYCLTTANAEIAAHRPAPHGTLVAHGFEYGSSHLGFSLGYLRWYSLAMMVPFEITTAMVNLGLWSPEPRMAVRLSIVTVLIILFNMLPQRAFRRTETLFTGLKIVTTAGLALCSLFLAIRGLPGTPIRGFRYWHEPGPLNEYLCLLYSVISFTLTPEITVQRAEQNNTDQSPGILSMARVDSIQLFALYILSVFMMTLASPFDEPRLTNHGMGAGQSPFIVGIERAKIPVLPVIVTALFFLSSIASGRSFLYLSSRTLYTLAEQGHAPALLATRNRWEVPYVAIITSALLSLSAIFNSLMYFITTSGSISWLFSCVIYLRFLRKTEAHTVLRVHQSRVQPYGVYFGILGCILLPIANALVLAFPAPTPDEAPAVSWSGLRLRNAIPVYLGICAFLLLYSGHRARAALIRRATTKAQEEILHPVSSNRRIAITHPTTEPFPVTVPLNSPVVNGAVSDSVAPEEEEPYTIKCICAFEDDDGNTHIECYYHGRDVPEVHNCVECEPRSLDGRRATERQRRLREQNDGDRKAKRSGTKSHKKKPREHGDQVNGFHHRSESSARDQPLAKKVKTNHRSSGSVSSASGVPNFPADARKRAAPSMSPTKTSGPSIPLYSQEFLHLYDHDQDYASMDSNLFVNLPLATELAAWVSEPEAIAQISNGRSAQDIFTWSDAPLDRSRWPTLSTETITDSSIEVEGQHPTWKILKTRDRVGKDEIVGEITGKIGLLRDYCLDPSNGFQELRHPQPFVFFHPQLPLYIDSRHEGSVLRYVRRSCRPNVTMKTYITNQVEYHFCFVAKEDIAADSELTAVWYLDPQLFESTNGLVKQESSENVTDTAANCISNVLAHFGGCNVDRRRHPKALDTNAKQVNAKRKKTKPKTNISPPAANSRAGSETTRNPDEDDQADSRSASGSARDQTHSRDLTPTLQIPTEGFTQGDSELSAREKRKIAAAEKKFQQLEQDQQAMQKRRKRASGQSTHGARERQSHSPPSGGPVGSLPGMRHGSPRKASGDPSTPSVRSPLMRLHYVDSAIQTDSDANDSMLSPSLPSSRRPSFVPLTQRLLKRCYSDRVKLEKSQSPISPQPNLGHTDSSPASPSPQETVPLTATTPSVSAENQDADMQDVDSPLEISPSQSHDTHLDASPLSGRGSVKPPLPSPWPSTAAHNTRIPGNTGNRPRTGLRVPLPPAISTSHPSTTSPRSTAPLTFSSPSAELSSQASSHPTMPTTPASGVAGPSPVKKKLSLGDYLIRRGTLTTPTSEKTQAQATAMLPPTPHGLPPTNRDGGAAGHHYSPRETKTAEEAEGNRTAERGTQEASMKDVSRATTTSHIPSAT